MQTLARFSTLVAVIACLPPVTSAKPAIEEREDPCRAAISASARRKTA